MKTNKILLAWRPKSITVLGKTFNECIMYDFGKINYLPFKETVDFFYHDKQIRY